MDTNRIDNRKSLTWKLSLIQFTFFALCAATTTFITVYFVSIGFSNSAIGIIIAGANLLGIFLQPYVTKLEFMIFKSNVQKAGIYSGLLTCLFEVIMFLLNGRVPFLAVILYTLSLILYISGQSFVNIIGIQYENIGYKSNFSLTRGFGSVGYAISCIVISRLVTHFSEPAIPVIAAILAIFHGVSFLLIPSVGEMDYCVRPSDDTRGGIEPMFYVLLIASYLLVAGSNIVTGYSYQILTYIHEDVNAMGNLESLSAFLELPAMSLIPLCRKKFKLSSLLIFSAVFYCIKNLMPALFMNLTGLYIQRIMQPFSYAILIPVMVYYINETLPEHQHARAQVLNVQFNFMTTVIASACGGLIIDFLGIPSLLVIGSVITAVGLILLLYVLLRKKA